MSGMIDIHQHVVYGMDDGARTREAGEAMLRAAAANGTEIVLGTSHVTPGVEPFDLGLYQAHLDELNAWSEAEGLGVWLLPGAEVLYTAQTERFLRERRIPTLGGTDWVLIEFDPGVRYEELRKALTNVALAGNVPVLAHMERYENLAGSVKKCLALKRELDVLFQMNCSTVIGGRGFLRDRQARKLLDEGLIDAVASDAHNVDRRPTRMRAAYEALAARYGEETACRLTGQEDEGGLWRALREAARRGRHEHPSPAC